MASEGRAMGILQRSSSLIQLLAERGPLSTAEVAEEIGMPRPSVYRLADALTQTRLVESASDGKLRLSLRWLKLSDAARSACGSGLTHGRFWTGWPAGLDRRFISPFRRLIGSSASTGRLVAP